MASSSRRPLAASVSSARTALTALPQLATACFLERSECPLHLAERRLPSEHCHARGVQCPRGDPADANSSRPRARSVSRVRSISDGSIGPPSLPGGSRGSAERSIAGAEAPDGSDNVAPSTSAHARPPLRSRRPRGRRRADLAAGAGAGACGDEERLGAGSIGSWHRLAKPKRAGSRPVAFAAIVSLPSPAHHASASSKDSSVVFRRAASTEVRPWITRPHDRRMLGVTPRSSRDRDRDDRPRPSDRERARTSRRQPAPRPPAAGRC